jgi:hypothetical protein
LDLLKSEISSNRDYSVAVLDGIQNIIPHGVSSDLQMSTSNLVDAYKEVSYTPKVV